MSGIDDRARQSRAVDHPTAVTPGTTRRGTPRAPTDGGPGLPRRRPGARLPTGLRGDTAAHPEPDDAVLIRIRSALKALH